MLTAKELSKFLNDTYISNSGFDENNSNDSLHIVKRDECKNIFNNVRMGNRNKLVFGHLNINSFRNKFEFLSEQVKGNIDIITISEIKVDDSFPIGNFLGVMLFVREDIASNLLAIENKPIEGLYVESNLRIDKWLINCSYNPHKNTISTHIDQLSKSLDLFSANYEKVILLVDFNFEV